MNYSTNQTQQTENKKGQPFSGYPYKENKFTFVVLGGFEPPLTEPKTVVLPLHHGTILIAVQR